MPALANLTEIEFKQLLDDYFSPPEKRHKMTQREVMELAVRLNSKINVPLISESREEQILVKIVVKIDTFLYDNLPNEFYDLVRSVDRGIDDDEAKRLIKRLANLANDKIDIPYIPEPMEHMAIRFVIGVIVNAARKDCDLKKAQDNSDNMLVSAAAVVSDSDLEAMIG